MGSEFRASVAAGARDMAEQATVTETLERAVEMCRRALTHCDMAGVSVAEARRVRTVVASTERLRVVDAAFGVLRRLSSNHSVKIARLADDLVHHGRLPGRLPGNGPSDAHEASTN